MIQVTWDVCKTFINNREAKYKYIDVFGMYVIVATDEVVTVECRIAKKTPPGAEQTEFEASYKAQSDNIPLDGASKFVKQVVSSAITYKGETIDSNAALTDQKWRVQRLLTTAGVTTEQYAGGKNYYSNRFSDAATLFPTPVLLDTESLLFDGINDEVNFGNTFNYDHSNQFSIEVWLNPDNLSAARHLFSKATNDANVYGFNMRHDATTGALFLQMRSSGSLRQHTFSTTLTASVWQHIIMTYDGSSNISGTRVYKNAVVGDTPASGTIGASWLSGQDFMLGSRNGIFEFSGKMNQFVVWSKALSSTEVTTRYNGGVPSDPTLESFSGDLVTWCPMGSADEGDSNAFIFDNVGSNHGSLINFSATPYSTDVP